jgi:hypothetical protein
MSVPADPQKTNEETYDTIMFEIKAKQTELVNIFENTMSLPLISFPNRLNLIAEGTD